MWRYELHSLHLINVATLPCESRNSKMLYYSGTLPKKIASNISYMLHRNGPVDYKIWAVMQQFVYETKMCDIYDLQKCLTQTWVDFEQNVIESALDKWRDNLRSCMRAACWWRTLWTYAAKLLCICIMWFIRTFCETVNVIWCIWRLFCS